MTTRPHPLRQPRRWLEPWFSAYALVGLMVNALVPILIPVTVAPHGPGAVGLVIAAFFGGQLTAPVIGALADRTGRQRAVFLGSFPVMALAACGFGLAGTVPMWALAAAVAGVAAGAAQTIGSVLIVEGHPRSEWDERIGWFRLSFGLGQVAGLTIGAVFANGRTDLGWYVGGAVILLGVVLGRIGLPRLSPAIRPHSSTGSTGGSGLVAELRGPFGIFLLTWLLAMISVQTILNVMPLVMAHAFDVRASSTATYYLIGSAVGALLYPVCGALAKRTSAARVLGIGMSVNLVAFMIMSLAWLLDLPGGHVIGPATLIIVAIGYPFDYVGGTMLAAELTLDGEGSAMGLFNSAVAAGAIVGAVVPAFFAARWGYGSLAPLAAGIMLTALLVGIPFLRHPSKVG